MLIQASKSPNEVGVLANSPYGIDPLESYTAENKH